MKKLTNNIQQIEEELLRDDISEVKYWGFTFVVFKTQGDAEKLVKYYQINRQLRYCK